MLWQNIENTVGAMNCQRGAYTTGMQKELQNPFTCDADQHFDTSIKWVGLILGWIPLCTENKCSLQKQPFLVTPLHWGCFHEDERLLLRDRNFIPMM